MPCALEKIIMAEVSELVNVIDVSHDVNSILYGVNNIYQKVGILLKVINVFHSGNLALSTVTSIHSIRKSTKLRNLETRRKAVQSSNVKKIKRQ